MSSLMREAIMLRRKRLKAKPGLGTEDTREKRMITLGEGVDEDTLETGARTDHSSTDELSPSLQEMDARGVEHEGPEDVNEEEQAEEKDMGVFDERAYRAAKEKKKKGLYDRLQMNLGKKLIK